MRSGVKVEFFMQRQSAKVSFSAKLTAPAHVILNDGLGGFCLIINKVIFVLG